MAIFNCYVSSPEGTNCITGSAHCFSIIEVDENRRGDTTRMTRAHLLWPASARAPFRLSFSWLSSASCFFNSIKVTCEKEPLMWWRLMKIYEVWTAIGANSLSVQTKLPPKSFKIWSLRPSRSSNRLCRACISCSCLEWHSGHGSKQL